MEKTHWQQSPNKNYLGHPDLPNGDDLVVTIESAKWEVVKNPILNTSEEKRVIRFKDKKVKPMICNQTNANTIINVTGVKFMEDSVGQRIQLYVANEKIKGIQTDCLRIRKFKPEAIEKKELLPDSKEWKAAISQGVSIERVKQVCKITNLNEKKYINELTKKA